MSELVDFLSLSNPLELCLIIYPEGFGGHGVSRTIMLFG
jgi:hypothetical protein